MTGHDLTRGWSFNVQKDGRKLLLDIWIYHVNVQITKESPAPPLGKAHSYICEESFPTGTRGQALLNKVFKIVEIDLGGVVVLDDTERHHFYVVYGLYDPHAKPAAIKLEHAELLDKEVGHDLLHPYDEDYKNASTHHAQRVLDRAVCPEVFRQHHRVEHYAVLGTADLLDHKQLGADFFDPSAKNTTTTALWWTGCEKSCGMAHCEMARDTFTLMQQNDIEMSVRAAYQLLPLPDQEECAELQKSLPADVEERMDELLEQWQNGEATPAPDAGASSASPAQPRRSPRQLLTPSDLIYDASGIGPSPEKLASKKGKARKPRANATNSADQEADLSLAPPRKRRMAARKTKTK